MKIIFVAVALSAGGTATVLKNVVPILMKNHEITILTNDEGNIEFDCHKLIKLKSIPIVSKYNYMPELMKMMKNDFFDQFDIIHIFEYTNFAADYLTFKKNSLKTPIIISTHGTVHQNANFQLKFFKKIHNFFMQKLKNRIDGFIASSEVEKNHLIKHSFSENKINVIRLGINPIEIKRNNLQKKNILYIGRLSVTKNIPILIHAFALCNLDDLNLIIAGPDDGMLNKLKKLVDDLKLSRRVFFKGKISDEEKNNLLSNATIFIHPSLQDIFSLSLVEAAGAGVPCIAFDVEGNSEIFDNMKTGMLVKKSDAESLKEAIISLLSDPNLQQNISNNAKEIIPKKFNWQKTTKILETYYLEIIKNLEKTGFN